MIIVNEFIEDINIIENELNIVICNETSIRDTVYYGFLNYFGFKSLKYKNINELVVVDSKYEKINKKDYEVILIDQQFNIESDKEFKSLHFNNITTTLLNSEIYESKTQELNLLINEILDEINCDSDVEIEIAEELEISDILKKLEYQLNTEDNNSYFSKVLMLREALKGIKMKNRIIILNSPEANIGTQDLCELFDELIKVEGTRIVFTNDFTTCSRVSNKSAIHLLKNGKKMPYNDMLKETEMFIKSYCENRLLHALECKFKNSNNFDVEFEKIIDEYIIF